MKLFHLALPAFLIGLGLHARAQTNFPEIENNETKALATVVNCLAPGDTLSGTSTGSATIGVGPTTADTFRMTVCTQALGLYKQRMTFSSGGTGHLANLRGLTQTAGVINATTDITFQQGSTASSPTQMNQWYGFGKMEELYYRVTGTAASTAPYFAVLSSTPVVPTVVPGGFTPGTITISSIGQTTIDTEIWLYDGNLDPVYHNDDEGPGGPTSQSRLTTTLAAGTYYVAISTYELANNLSDLNFDEDYLQGPVMDFPNLLVNSNTTSPVDVDFTITDGVTTVPVTALTTGYFDVFWASFIVGTPPAFTGFCSGDGSLTDHTTPCPCANNGLPGNGCGHSFDPNGANLAATGTAAADDVLLTSSFEPATAFTLFMQHDAAGDAVFHDGVLCAGGTLIRLRGRAAAGGQAFFPNPVWDSSITLSQRGSVTVGSGARRYYAAWYRNASTSFCPPATANVTNGWMIDW